MTTYHLTLKSTNKKTGYIPVSTSSRDTCPPSCPWYEKGCYANGGPLYLHWRQISNGNRGERFAEFLEKIERLPREQLWRHNQAGDLPGKGERINSHELARLVKASSNTKGFTYTHKPVIGSSHIAKRNRLIIKRFNLPCFCINLSANGLENADRLIRLKISPVTTVLSSSFSGRNFETPRKNDGIVCPASYRSITCKECGLCAISTRTYIIGFPAHGLQKNSIDRRIN